MTTDSPAFVSVYEIVCRIPRGKVLTYGLISHLIGKRLSAQGVGWALNALPGSAKVANGKKYHSQNVPWHRVVNSKGGMSTHKIIDIPPDMQKQLLEAEGVKFDSEDKMVLDDYLWHEGLV